MPELRGLPGVKRRALPCAYAGSIDQAVHLIQKRRAVTASGADGALNIWRDDAKRLRSEFHRYQVTLNSAQHEDLDCLRAWLRVWWPKLGIEALPMETTA